MAHRHRHRRRLNRRAVQVVVAVVAQCVLQRRAHSVMAGAPLRASARVRPAFSAAAVVDAEHDQHPVSERLARVQVLVAQPDEAQLAALPGATQLSVQGLAGQLAGVRL